MNTYIKLFFFLTTLLYFISPGIGAEKKNKKKTNRKTRQLRWLSESDQFVIYQDRKISKRKKSLVSLSLMRHKLNGISQNDDLQVDYFYYFSEMMAIGGYFNLSSSSIDADIEKRNDSDLFFHNKSLYQIGILFEWAPLYGKHLYNRKVIYTDAGFNMGLGLSKYEHNAKTLQTLNSSTSFEAGSSIDLKLATFLRIFIENKYFIKITYHIRNTELQSSNNPGELPSGTSRVFINNFGIAGGYKF